MQIDLSGIQMIDTHEHLRPETERVAQGADALAILFSHYTSTDLQTAGLSRRDLAFVRDRTQPLDLRWAIAAPYWEWARNTAYGRAIRLAARELYEIDSINQQSIHALAERMQQASVPGLYQRIFRQAGITYAIVQDIDPGPLPSRMSPPGLLRPVMKGGPFIWIRNKSEIEQIIEQIGYPPVHSLDDWLGVCEAAFQSKEPVVAIKLAHAYVASLEAGKPAFREAEAAFNRIVRRRELFGVDESLNWEESRPLRDYLVHHIIRLAVRYHLPIQIHTGLLENTFNDIRDAYPLHLIPILLEYPEAKFVLFHGGYPWLGEFAALGKAYPNVWLDLSWLWIISPSAGRELLHRLIETVPANKVCAFGGDYLFVEGVYAHSRMARENIARVLAEKIAEGWFSQEEARQYGYAVLAGNAHGLYSPAEDPPLFI